MQPAVVPILKWVSAAFSFLPAGAVNKRSFPTGQSRHKMIAKSALFSEFLTIFLLQSFFESLRQGCTLLATYKCTLEPELPFRGFLNRVEKRGGRGLTSPRLQHGAV